MPGVALTSSGTAFIEGTYYTYRPMSVSRPIEVRSIQFEITSGGSNAQTLCFAIYEADDDWQPGRLVDVQRYAYPGGSATGVVTITHTPFRLPPGPYLQCYHASSPGAQNLTFRSGGGSISDFPMLRAGLAGNVIGTFRATGGFDSIIPDPGPPWTNVGNFGPLSWFWFLEWVPVA